jgi:hypothetical protein
MRPCTHTCMRACACMAAVTNSVVENTKTKDRAAGAGHEDGGVALALPHAGGRDSEAPRQAEGPGFRRSGAIKMQAPGVHQDASTRCSPCSHTRACVLICARVCMCAHAYTGADWKFRRLSSCGALARGPTRRSSPPRRPCRDVPSVPATVIHASERRGRTT